MLKESRYTTVLSGYEMLLENGYPAIRDGSESYDIEAKYGFSLEEMFPVVFIPQGRSSSSSFIGMRS